MEKSTPDVAKSDVILKQLATRVAKRRSSFLSGTFTNTHTHTHAHTHTLVNTNVYGAWSLSALYVGMGIESTLHFYITRPA